MDNITCVPLCRERHRPRSPSPMSPEESKWLGLCRKSHLSKWSDHAEATHEYVHENRFKKCQDKGGRESTLMSMKSVTSSAESL